MNVTKQQVVAAVETIRAIGEAIRELGEVPSGHLYANMMGSITLENYEAAIRALVDVELVQRGHDHLLRWIGPEAPRG